MLTTAEGTAGDSVLQKVLKVVSGKICSNMVVQVQVRNAQLDKEAGELRRENVELFEAAEVARKGMAHSEEARRPSANQ